MSFHDKMPRLDLVSEKAQDLSDQGYDVHTFSIVLYDGAFWQVRIETTNDDMEDVVFLYILSKHGDSLEETDEHRP